MSVTAGRRLRWWPAVLVVALCVLAEAWVWLRPGPIRQTRVINTFIVSFVAAALLLLWFLLFSRARPRWRLLALGAVVVAGLFLSQFVAISGVTGDLVPILGWKGGKTGPDGAVILSWVEPDGDGHRLRFSQWRDAAWSEPRTVAAGAGWFDVNRICA